MDNTVNSYNQLHSPIVRPCEYFSFADNRRSGIEAMDEPLTQNDLDTLFEDILAETKKPREVKEVKNAESLKGSEFLSQDQIDELLKAFQND